MNIGVNKRRLIEGLAFIIKIAIKITNDMLDVVVPLVPLLS